MPAERSGAQPVLQSERHVLLRWLALLFVVASLISLVAVPVLVDRRVDQLRSELEHAADPARTLVIRLQLSLAAEMSALRGFLVTGDEPFLAEYGRATDAERVVNEQLEPLAQQLGSPVVDRFVEVRTLINQWHARIRQDEILAQRREHPDEVPIEQPLFEQALRAAVTLDSTIATVTQARRDEVRATERFGLRITFVLGMLALLASAVTAWLTRNIQRYAAEAEQRRTEAEQALASTAAAVNARTRLLRGVTHDVKNPLGAAYGYAELLEMGVKGPLTEEQAKLATGVRLSIESALAIIGDLLDLSRAESEGLRIERTRVDLAVILREVVQQHMGEAERAGHQLELRARELYVHTDPVRVRQVLGNLISNALKYTPAPGTIIVSTEEHVQTDNGKSSWGLVHVDDSGPGIPLDERERVFTEFYRMEGVASPGHGLGLAISRRLARLVGGNITIAQSAAGGARFTLWLPCRASEGAAS